MREGWVLCRLFLYPYLLTYSRVCGEGSQAQAWPSQVICQTSQPLLCDRLYYQPCGLSLLVCCESFLLSSLG